MNIIVLSGIEVNVVHSHRGDKNETVTSRQHLLVFNVDGLRRFCLVADFSSTQHAEKMLRHKIRGDYKLFICS